MKMFDLFFNRSLDWNFNFDVILKYSLMILGIGMCFQRPTVLSISSLVGFSFLLLIVCLDLDDWSSSLVGVVLGALSIISLFCLFADCLFR